MRSINSIKNAIAAMVMSIATILVGFISQRVFVQTLGTEYLGINGLFTNILSMLSVVELGLGSAIIYHLYKPIAENDIEKIKSLMLFYKIAYRVIAILIAIMSICTIPFLKLIVGEVSIKESIIYIFILTSLDIIASYLLTYKRSILYANQKNYIVNIVHIVYLVVMNATQILFLILTHDYILYLWIKIICRVLENIVLTHIANIIYPFIKDKKVNPIDKKMKKSIFTKVKGLIYHKIGTVLVTGTDNVIISSFLGVTTVGLYSNYYLVINAILNLFHQAFGSLLASVGNLLVEGNYEKSYKIYKNMLFMNSWIFAFASAGVCCIMEPFVKVWLGNEYILPFSVLAVLVANLYIQGVRKTNTNFQEAAGIYYEDRYIPIISAIVNIVASIILVKIIGLPGVFLGTILSTLVLFLYSYPVYVYMPLFKKKYRQYIKDYVPYVSVAIISIITTYMVTSNINVNNNILQIIINLIIVCIIPNIIHLLIFFKSEELKYYVMIVKGVINKRKQQNEP